VLHPDGFSRCLVHPGNVKRGVILGLCDFESSVLLSQTLYLLILRLEQVTDQLLSRLASLSFRLVPRPFGCLLLPFLSALYLKLKEGNTLLLLLGESDELLNNHLIPFLLTSPEKLVILALFTVSLLSERKLD